MNRERSQPPAAAVWLLQHLNQEALAGDLLERFSEGQSDWWFWRQVLIAAALGLSRNLRLHWVHICFAMTGYLLIRLSLPIMQNPMVHRARLLGLRLDWPMSITYEFVFHAALSALMVLPILAALLLVKREFSWVSMARVFLISLPLLALVEFGSAVVVSHRFSMDTRMFFESAPFFVLLLAAWIGAPVGSENIPAERLRTE